MDAETLKGTQEPVVTPACSRILSEFGVSRFRILSSSFLIETHSLPTLARCYPHSFTFYVAFPKCSIRPLGFAHPTTCTAAILVITSSPVSILLDLFA
jgi:hypothetical protein